MADRCYGLLAEYAQPQALIAAARAARGAGYSRIEAYSPFPLEALEEILGTRDDRVYAFGIGGALLGAGLGLGMQVYANLDYPLPVGGLPLIALQSFGTVTFLLMVTGAVLSAVFGLFWLARLPLLHHPLHEVEAFARATDDRFLLCIRSDDPRFERAGTALWLAATAVSVSEVPA